tara:strand:- start:135 stop:296 length:162 start_codon:yes stop_codon:yes gene_type:complete
MKLRVDISRLSQEQFEMILEALILLKKSNPARDVYLNEKTFIQIISELNKIKK